MKRENRYLVFKLKDVDESLTDEEIVALYNMAEDVAHYRKEVGKPPLECVVVESDWPEYEPTRGAIERRMDAETNRESFSRDLESLINRHCKENGSDTPDFILSEYLLDALAAFDKAVSRRTKWYR